jgi:Secretin and TonB N terminus short domain
MLKGGKTVLPPEIRSHDMSRSSLHLNRWLQLTWVIVLLVMASLGRAQTPPDKKADESDQDRIRRILAEFKKDRRERQNTDDPQKSAAAQAAGQMKQTADRIAGNRQLQERRDRGLNDTLGGVDRSALSPDRDITYPKDWQERTQARASSLNPMTAKEKAILRGLDSSITVRLKNGRLEDLIDYIRDKTDLNILMDPAALKEADVTYDSTVSLDVKNVSVRTALRMALANLGLTYVIRNEGISVVTPAMAKQMFTTRVYYIRDLLPSDWGFFSAIEAARLIDLITSTVEPQSWKVNGGEGSIVYDPVRRALVVKQSAEFQSVLSSGTRR